MSAGPGPGPAVGSQQLDVGGERTNVVRHGLGAPLLLVHGFPSNALAWRLVMRHLEDRYAMIAPDQVGFGLSTRNAVRPLDGDAYADRLDVLLDLLGLHGTDVVGLSWGGAVAQRLALRHPARVRRLVLIAPVSAARPLRLGTGPIVAPIIGARFPRLARRFVRRYLQRATGGDLSRVDLDAVAHGYVDPLSTPGSIRFLRRFVRATHETPATDVGRIAVPTMIITPDADRIVPPEVGLELAAAIPGSRLEVIPEAGHALQFEAPARVAELIDEFVSAV